MKKEVIQQLCIESMTHSTLNKSLVENVNMETGLELVIHEVANQRGPTPQRTSVVYELKPGALLTFPDISGGTCNCTFCLRRVL